MNYVNIYPFCKLQVIRSEEGFCVQRPVIVDMSKVLGQKKFNFGRDPDSVMVYSGKWKPSPKL